MTPSLTRLKRFAISAALSTACVGMAWAQAVPSMEDIERAWAKGDLEGVRAALTERIRTDTTALTAMRLGRMLVEGLGGPPDRDAGLQLLQRAADQGHLPAFTLMGRVYLSPGEGRSPETAARVLRIAATRGDAEAKYYMGILYKDGVGVSKEQQQAFAWMQGASEGGYGPAMLELSRFFADGIGTIPDTEKARHWLSEAANASVPEAQFAQANELLYGAQPNPAKAVPLLASAAQRGFVPAQRVLGTLYLTGADGVDVQADLAEQLLIAAARSGDLSAINNLGTAYLSGAVLDQNFETAITLLERASDANLARATFTLARVYDRGAGVPADSKRAMRLYRLAVQQGSLPARKHLAELVLADQFPENIAPHSAVPWVMALVEAGGRDDAIAWMEKQADSGVRPAQAALGAWYIEQDGKGARALVLLEAAARNGHVPSQFRIGSAMTTGAGGAKIDYVQAHKWLNVAATSGHVQAMEIRDAITDLMTPEQIADAQSRTRAFFDTARSVPASQKP